MTVIEHEIVTDGAAGGPYTAAAEQELQQMLGGGTTILTTSCTDALEMAAILANIQQGDEVIVPSFGFVTTALAFVRAGARVRFADIDPRTLALDPDSVAAVLTPATRAVVPIHYAGLPAPIDTITAVAERVGAMVIEDCAHGLGGAIDGKALGRLAPLSALSFHATKNFSCGEGGALVINDDTLVERARIVLDKGTDRRAFLDGSVDKYTWRDLGSSFGLSDYLAARLLTELRSATSIQSRRRDLHEAYDTVLASGRAHLGYRTPLVDPGVQPAYHLYFVVLEDASKRDRLITRLKEHEVAASFHFVPLHQTPGGRQWGAETECPVSERVAASLIRLPMHQRMTVEDARRNAEIFLECLAELA